MPRYTLEERAAFEKLRPQLLFEELIKKVETKSPTPAWVFDEIMDAFVFGYRQGQLDLKRENERSTS